MLIKTYGSAVHGISATTICIEVDVGKGVKAQLIGLPDNAVKESLTRIFAALKNSGFHFPRKGVIINMSPADLRKEGASYDLPIALGILIASEQIEIDDISTTLFMAELGLDGGLLPIRGCLPMSLQAKQDGFVRIILPLQNAEEAAVVNDMDVYGISCLSELISFLSGGLALKPQSPPRFVRNKPLSKSHKRDFSEVKGQLAVKRAMEVAAAGGHNIILIGPPGSGKTMLAKRLTGILPPMQLSEALETTKIHSVAGHTLNQKGLLTARPFRHPHHTISHAAMVGGGQHPLPGEISLAHNGVLFLDELPEFKRSVLEVLRQPLEDGMVSISRARSRVEYPSNLMLVASMNPCPCGYSTHPEIPCSCSAATIQRYIARISGPLLDRIDIQVEINPVAFEDLNSNSVATESSEKIADRVAAARWIQQQRFDKVNGIHINAQMEGHMLREVCELDQACTLLLKTAMEKLQLSARAFDRILKVARTIADLDRAADIEIKHLAEAIQYRSLDREHWLQN